MKYLITTIQKCILDSYVSNYKFEIKNIKGFKVYYLSNNSNDFYVVLLNNDPIYMTLEATMLIDAIKPQIIINNDYAISLISNLTDGDLVISTKQSMHNEDIVYKSTTKLNFKNINAIHGLIISTNNYNYDSSIIKEKHKKALCIDNSSAIISKVCDYINREFITIDIINSQTFDDKAPLIFDKLSTLLIELPIN